MDGKYMKRAAFEIKEKIINDFNCLKIKFSQLLS